MKNVSLSKPFRLQNEKEIQEFKLQFDELSAADLRQIKKLEAQISDNTTVDAESMLTPKSMSFEFHLATVFLAAVKGTDGLMVSDFTRLPMKDALNIAEVASFFCLDMD